MKTVDLHTHTTFSDGTFTPKELVEYAVKKNLSAIAITDHDVTDGLNQAEYYGNKLGIEVIPGIEVSTDYEGTEVHIVGLFIDRYNSSMNKALEDMRVKRTQRNHNVAEKLQALGLNVEYADFEKAADGAIITRAHIAKALLAKGYVGYIGEAFERFIGDGKPAYIKREVFSWQDTINMINNARGTAIMAHPLLYKFSKKRLEQTLSVMAKYGLRGVETYYSTHTPSDTKYIKSLAEKYRLKLSGGSDFHGSNKPKLDLGTGYGDLIVPYYVLENLKQKGNIYG